MRKMITLVLLLVFLGQSAFIGFLKDKTYSLKDKKVGFLLVQDVNIYEFKKYFYPLIKENNMNLKIIIKDFDVNNMYITLKGDEIKLETKGLQWKN